MTWFQIYILIGALLSISLHRFVMSDLRSHILDAEFEDLGEHKNIGIVLLFVFMALVWPIYVIYFIARR